MTDVADGFAPAGEVPIAEAPIKPHELGPQVPDIPEKASKPSLDEALNRAVDKVSKSDKPEAKPETKPEAKVEPKADTKAAEPPKEAARAPDGKFAAKEQAEPKAEPPKVEAKPDSPHREPPSRFSPDAKTAWEAAPDPVKAEVHRAIKELEQGHQKYKADAEAWSELREFDQIAKQHGTTVKTALQGYINLEQQLKQDPLGGLEAIVSRIGLKTPDGRNMTLHDIAAHVLNQAPDEQSARQSATIWQLNAKIAQLEQMVGGVTQTIQQQQATATNAEVAAFAKDHPRFDELSEDIAFFLQSDKVPAHLTPRERLSEAYTLAERLNPAPAAPAQAAPAVIASQPVPLNPAGQKSIAGAPSVGSNPTRKGKAPSIDEALSKAFAGVG